MMLPWLIAIPLIGGIAAWIVGRGAPTLARWVSIAALALNLILVLALWGQAPAGGQGGWIAEFDAPWMPGLGVSFYLAVDGLSLLLIGLANFLGIAAVAASWQEIQERVGLYHLNLLGVLSAIIGVFLALDLFLFSFFWEAMLLPSYFLFVWGGSKRFQAAVRFFIFTQISGLLMLLAILGLYFVHGQATGNYTFNYNELLRTAVPAGAATWLMLGFFIAFAVKLPVVPFHSWQPDAYVYSPTGATVILAGVMAKTAGYGLLRFVVPLFPAAAAAFAPVAMGLGILGILYGAVLAYSQTDLKRLIAYSSVSHMGFVLLGVFAWTELSQQGAVVQMLAHGISTGALFIMAGVLQERLGTRELPSMGGLWAAAPRMSGVLLLFALASLGLPGLANFVAEFLILVGVYQVSILAAALGAVGILFATAYSLWMVQRAIHGPNEGNWQIRDLVPREALLFGVLIAATITLGLCPQPVLNTAAPSLAALRQAAGIQSPVRPAMAPAAATSPGAAAAQQSTGQGGYR